MSNDEIKIIEECKGVINTMSPLHLDIGSANLYLLNSVDMRIRIDLAPASLVLQSHHGVDYGYQLQSVRLWCQKIVPHASALLSLNINLISKNTAVEYIFDRPIIKNYIFPTGHNSLSLDNIFNGIVPHNVYMCFMKQNALTGDYNKNGSYLTHCNISSVRMELNGNTMSALNGNFPTEISQMFHHTLTNLKCEKNLLTVDNFRAGRTIFAWNLSSSESTDVMHIEKTGNLRITIQCSQPQTENIIVFLFGITNGLIEIDGARRVQTNYLM